MKICVKCGNSFTPTKNTYAIYCSKQCNHSAYLARLGNLTCANPNCDVEFSLKDKRQKYCSRVCSASMNNVAIQRECLFCSNPLERKQKKYCDHICRVNFQTHEKYEDWVNGYVDASNAKGDLNAWARQLLLEMCGHRCKCGWGEINPKVGKPILTVDHVDGDWTNNYCWNLEVLCYNCHTLTPTFGSLNRGSKSGTREYNYIRDIRTQLDN